MRAKPRTDWAIIRSEYINSALTYGDLARKHKLNENTVRQRGNRDDWLSARNDVSLSVTREAVRRASEARVDELVKFNADDLKMARVIRARAAQLMAGATNATELRALAGAVETAQKVGRLALGATTENTGVQLNELPASVDDFV